MFSVFQFYQLISSEIIAKFTLKSPRQQIETISDLVNSNISLVVLPVPASVYNKVNEDLFNKILLKTTKENTRMRLRNMFDEKWIVDTSYGRAVMFAFEVPLKYIAAKHLKRLKPNTKLRFIKERYKTPSLLTVASSRRLPKMFRDQINLRY